METSVSDDGDPSAHTSYYRITLLSFILLLACTQARHEPAKIALVAGDSIKAIGKKPPPPPVMKPLKKKKKIYLTFDDGPNKGTQNVLDIVQQENIPATFSLWANMFLRAWNRQKHGTAYKMPKT